jgi:hypothetical protein
MTKSAPQFSISRLILSGILAATFLIGCSAEPDVMNDPIPAKSTPVAMKATSSSPPATQVQDQQQGAVPNKTPGILDQAAGQAADLLDKAKSAGPMVGQTKKWLGDQIAGASDATGQTAEATSKWIADTYKTLKDSGMTTADSAQEWLREDWKNIGAWDYKVIIMPIVTSPESAAEVEKQLNELGSERWQCFNVSPNATGTVMYFKRSKESYMKHVPLKDVLHFVPFMKAIDSSDSGE